MCWKPTDYVCRFESEKCKLMVNERFVQHEKQGQVLARVSTFSKSVYWRLIRNLSIA